MTPEEFAERMKELHRGHEDPATDHKLADDLMARVLRQLGYGAGIDIYDRMDRSYL